MAVIRPVKYGANRMNIMSNGSFLDEMNASNKQEALVKSLTSTWEKKNSKAARAGGVSLMALTLAACGGSDDTPFSQADIDTAVGAVDTTADDAAAILAAVEAVDATATTVAEVAENANAAGVASVDITTDNTAATTLALRDAAAELGVTDTVSMTTVELITAIKVANDATIASDAAGAVDITTDNAAAVSEALGDYASVGAAYTAGADSVDITTDNAGATTLALRAAAAELGVSGTSTMTDAELITAIKTANDATIASDAAEAVDRTTDNAAAINTAVAADTSFDTLAELVAAYDALANPSDFDSGVNNLTGSDANSTYNAGLTAAGGNTLNALDTLDGGAGSDTLNVSIATAVTPGAITNVETINVTFTGAVALNLAQMSGATALINIGSSAAGSITNISSTDAALTVADNGVGATFAYKASSVTGGSDSVSLTLNNATGAATTTLTGAIETVNLASTGSANSVRLDSGATTLNISGSEDLTLAAASTVLASATTINAGDATGDITLASDAGAAVTVTGGAGADALTLSGGTSATDTVSGGAGNDRIIFTTDLADADVISGGDGNDTLVGDDGQLAGLTTANNVTGIEVLEASTVLATTMTVANVDSSISSVTLAGGANAGTLVMGAGSQTVALGTANAGGMTINDTGLATNDSLTVTAATGANSFGGQAVTVGGFETTSIATGDTNQTVTTVAVNGDPDSGGTNTSATLNLSGAGNFTTTGAITVGDATAGTATINAADMTGNFVMGAAAVGATTITGGAGDDTILGEDLASTLTGGSGTDSITGGSANDTILGGAGDDTLISSGGTDSISGEAGDDTFEMAVAQFNAADTLAGGDGTDSIELDGGAVVDTAFTNVTSVEVLTSDADAMSVTLGALAADAGIRTITLAGVGTDDSVTLSAEFDAASVTVNLNDLNSGGANDQNVVDGSAYTGSINFVGGDANTIDGANAAQDDLVLTGGTGTGDTLTIAGGTYTAAELGDITAVETWTVSDDVSTSFTIADANVADGASLVIDGRAIVDASKTFAVVGTLEADGAITVHGATGVDTITGTASDLGDTINTYAGADTLNFAVDNLTALDSVDGGAGDDTLTITSAGTLADADLTGVTNIEALTFTAAATSATLGAEYSESGASTITLTTGSNSLTMDAVTTAQTLNLVGGTDTIDASDMTAALTVSIDAAASLTSGDTITGGAGTSDNLSITFGSGITSGEIANVSAFETITAASDATGSLVTNDGNVASSGSMTIDLTANATSAFTTSIAAETNGQITINGGAGNDTITMSVSSMGDIINAGAGTDGVTVAIAQLNSTDTLDGGAGTDTLTFSDAGISADADFTNVSNMEALTLAAGANTLVLGSQYNEAGFATLNLSTGTENVTFGSGVTAAQTVAISTAANTIDASASSAAYTFTAGEDDVNATDTLTGGSGTGDTLTITFNGTGVTAAEMANVSGIETIKTATDAAGSLVLSDANNSTSTITVNAEANTAAAFTLDASNENDGTIVYVGGAGVDTVTGTTGADTIGGGAGADVITGGNGADTITGGAGADTFTYTATAQSTGTAKDSITDYVSGSDVINVTIDNSTATAAATYDATVQTAQAGTSNVQANLSGSIGQAIYDTTNSVLVVNSNADNLVTTLDYQIDVNAASTAANTIAAGDINYTITAGTGNDTIVAGSGNDTLNGGNGSDTITGGSGRDDIDGGAGADVILYTALTDGASVVTLTDVTSADDDFVVASSDADTVAFVTATDDIKIDGTLEGLLEASAARDISSTTANLDYNAVGVFLIATAQAQLNADNFGDISDLATNFNVGNGNVANTAAGDEILFTIENNAASANGLYYFKDVDGDGNMTDGDQVALLAVIEDAAIVAADIII